MQSKHKLILQYHLASCTLESCLSFSKGAEALAGTSGHAKRCAQSGEDFARRFTAMRCMKFLGRWEGLGLWGGPSGFRIKEGIMEILLNLYNPCSFYEVSGA